MRSNQLSTIKMVLISALLSQSCLGQSISASANRMESTIMEQYAKADDSSAFSARPYSFYTVISTVRNRGRLDARHQPLDLAFSVLPGNEKIEGYRSTASALCCAVVSCQIRNTRILAFIGKKSVGWI